MGAEKPFSTYHEGLGWRGRPSARGPFRGLDYATEVSLDAWGNRSPNPAFVADLRNVVVPGDSYGWGWESRTTRSGPTACWSWSPY